MRHKFIFTIISLSLLSCSGSKDHRKFRIAKDHSPVEYHIATVNNNVCKRLRGDIVLYAIFVDSKYTNPWTTHDILSTLDSTRKAINWVLNQADNSNVPLNITLDYYQNEKNVVPIEMNLTRKTLSGTLLGYSGSKNVDRWADQIGFRALAIYGPDTATITGTKIRPKDRERLIARIRDKHMADNVALVYFINNYYTDEISVAMHTADQLNPEYAVVSFKNPGTIVHEFLHLFGALDLYISPYDNLKATIRRKSFAMKEFPNEIMAFPYRHMDSLMISPLSKYLIGWDSRLDDRYLKMLTNGKVKVASY